MSRHRRNPKKVHYIWTGQTDVTFADPRTACGRRGYATMDTTRVSCDACLARLDADVVHFGRSNGRRSRRNPRQADVSMYQDILAHLRALQWIYTTAHWTSSGVNSYGDHLLLQRLYEGLEKPIDALGERMVAYFGSSSVAPGVINGKAQQIVEEASTKFAHLPDGRRSDAAGLLAAEKSLQLAIRTAWKANQDSGDEFSLGIDDYLMGLANDRDTAIYLLKQRTGQG